MEITDVLESLKIGKISVSEAKKQLALYSIEKIEDFAQIDIGRKHRKGIPEVIFAERKTSEEIKKIMAIYNVTDLDFLSEPRVLH